MSCDSNIFWDPPNLSQFYLVQINLGGPSIISVGAYIKYNIHVYFLYERVSL